MLSDVTAQHNNIRRHLIYNRDEEQLVLSDATAQHNNIRRHLIYNRDEEQLVLSDVTAQQNISGDIDFLALHNQN